jgi:hypothetical protein
MPCPPSHRRWSTCDPPHKQLLVRLGVGGVLRHQSSPHVVVVPIIKHLQSTLRAGARSGGGGWCGSLLVLPMSLSSPIVEHLQTALRSGARNSGGR